MALYFDKSVRQVQRWVKEPGFPRLSGRRFDLLQVQQWLDHRDGQAIFSRPTPPADPRQPNLVPQQGRAFEDARLKTARANLLELDLKQRHGELVLRREVEQLFVARIMAVKQGLLSLARALPPQLAPVHTNARWPRSLIRRCGTCWRFSPDPCPTTWDADVYGNFFNTDNSKWFQEYCATMRHPMEGLI